MRLPSPRHIGAAGLRLLIGKSYLEANDPEGRQWRDEQANRASLANGSALATCVLAVATRPSLFPYLHVSIVLFSLGLIYSIIMSTFQQPERMTLRSLEKMRLEVSEIDAALARAESVPNASVLSARRADLMPFLTGPQHISVSRDVSFYGTLNSIMFVAGIFAALLWSSTIRVDFNAQHQAEFTPLNGSKFTVKPVTIPPLRLRSLQTPSHAVGSPRASSRPGAASGA